MRAVVWLNRTPVTTSADWGDAANGNLVLMGVKCGYIPWKLYSYWISLFVLWHHCVHVRTYIHSSVCMRLPGQICVQFWIMQHAACVYIELSSSMLHLPTGPASCLIAGERTH